MVNHMKTIKVFKRTLLFLLIIIVGAIILCRTKNDNINEARLYGETYSAELIAKIQNASDFEFAVKKISYDHKSVKVLGSETRLQPARFPVGATLIPAVDNIDKAIQKISASLTLKQVEVIGVENYIETPDSRFWGTLTFYIGDTAITGISFDIASGYLRQKIYDESKENYLILLYEIDPSASDILSQELSSDK